MAQKIRMPDGKVVAFPDDMPQEEIRALIESKYPEARPENRAASKASGKLKGKVSELPSKQPPKKTLLGEAADYASQGLSGVYEGAADLAGFPVDLIAGGMNAGIDASNANLGTNIPRIDKPVGGSQMFRDYADPVIGEESTEPGKQVVRRIGQEVGSAMIPGLGMAAKAAKPAAVIGNTLKTAVGSGAGAAVAEQVAPGNIWAEIAGQVIGGGATGLVKGGKGIPKADKAVDLQVKKQDAYKAVDDLGARYTPQSYASMTNTVEQAVKAKNISPTRHPKAFSFVQDMKTRFQNGMSLTELDQLRQEVRRDLLRSSDESERFFGDVIIDEIDDFIAKAGPREMAAGSGPEAAKAITTARELNTRWRKTEMIEDALYAAEQRTAATETGSGMNGAIKRAFNTILLNEKKRRAFSASEIADMENIVKGGNDGVLGKIGALSGDSGLKALIHAALVSHLGPAYAIIPVGAAIAKGAATAATGKRAATLRAKVASGNSLRAPNPDRGLATTAATIGGISAVNDNERRTNTLRMNALN